MTMLVKVTLIFALTIAATSAAPASIDSSFAQSNPKAAIIFV